MSKCLVVLASILEKEGFLKPGFLAFDVKIRIRFLRLIEEWGVFQERFGPEGVENNPVWQQIIPYIVLRRKNLFFIYERGGAGSAYQEKRLQGRVSCGIGGHVESQDRHLMRALYRELNEEVVFTLFNSSAPVQFDGQVEILGLVKDDTNDVGRVHLGVVGQVQLGLNFDISLNPQGDEAVSGRFVNALQYQNLVKSGNVKTDTWTEIVFRECL